MIIKGRLRETLAQCKMTEIKLDLEELANQLTIDDLMIVEHWKMFNKPPQTDNPLKEKIISIICNSFTRLEMPTVYDATEQILSAFRESLPKEEDIKKITEMIQEAGGLNSPLPNDDRKLAQQIITYLQQPTEH
jgi:hypothetical protein